MGTILSGGPTVNSKHGDDAGDLVSCRLALQGGEIAAEDAALSVTMMHLRAEYAIDSVSNAIDLTGSQHPYYWRSKVDPKRGPVLGQERGSETACWIHAHSRDGRFEDYIDRDEEASKYGGPFVQSPGIRYCQYGGHHEERDEDFGGEGSR